MLGRLEMMGLKTGRRLALDRRKEILVGAARRRCTAVTYRIESAADRAR